MIPTVLLTGTVGIGKTAVAAEIGTVLEEQGVGAAVVDLDWLGWVTGPARPPGGLDQLILDNLSAILPNLVSAGTNYLVLARLVEDPGLLDALRSTIPGGDLTTIRLIAPSSVIAARLERRDTGAIRDEHLAQSAGFSKLLDEAAIEDFEIPNDSESIRAVALAILDRLDWPRPPG